MSWCEAPDDRFRSPRVSFARQSGTRNTFSAHLCDITASGSRPLANDFICLFASDHGLRWRRESGYSNA
jgi:hypothetical protein